MASKDLHLAKYAHNRRLAESLGDDYADWIVTVAFYAAVHKVEAVFDAIGGEHSDDHKMRNGKLRRDNRFHAVRKPFNAMFAAARMARYDCPGDDEKETQDPLFTIEAARDEFLGDRLNEVSKACDKILLHAKKR